MRQGFFRECLRMRCLERDMQISGLGGKRANAAGFTFGDSWKAAVELVENAIDFSVWRGTSAKMPRSYQPLALFSSDGLWTGRLWIL